VADRSIDARAKTGTAPDEISELRFKSAHQSLITDVSGFAPSAARSSSLITPVQTALEVPACAFILDEGHQSEMREALSRISLSLIRATI
jgi:hypothetical protein